MVEKKDSNNNLDTQNIESGRNPEDNFSNDFGNIAKTDKNAGLGGEEDSFGQERLQAWINRMAKQQDRTIQKE